MPGMPMKNKILQWQRNGWLLPYSEEELGLPKGLIPLMAVVQKQKVRPVLDYWELNGFVDAFTANAEVCTQKVRVVATRSQCIASRSVKCISSDPCRLGAIAVSNSHF